MSFHPCYLASTRRVSLEDFVAHIRPGYFRVRSPFLSCIGSDGKNSYCVFEGPEFPPEKRGISFVRQVSSLPNGSNPREGPS